MNGIKVYRAHNAWGYEVWFQSRCVVIGCCATGDAAYMACNC
jgi:hypothetical protein